MASDKRSFTDFVEFPGDIENGKYQFPTLKWTNSHGKSMIWNATVRLMPTKFAKRKYVVNWNTSTDEKEVVPISKQHIQMDKSKPTQTGKGIVSPPAGTVAQMWTVNGREDMNPTTSIPTFIMTGKNIGRANETNVLTQALITMRSKYFKKIDKGYRLEGHQDDEEEKGGAKPYYMMAYHKWIDTPRDPARRIVFPAAGSIKFDGTRVQTHAVNGHIYFSSRRKKLFPPKPHLELELQPMFAKYPGMYLDSEAFIEGSNLNVITGIMVRESNKSPNVQELMLNVFDMFVTEGRVPYGTGNKFIDAKSSFTDRSEFLDVLFAEFMTKHIHRIDQEIMNDEKEYDEFHNDAVSTGNEGTVIRNLAAPYEFSDRREIRSYQVRKRKPRYDDKFKVVGYTQGINGKAVGAIILILETAKGGHKFNADPEDIDMKARYKIYKNMTKKKFADNWFGKKMTVTYHALSTDGIPLQPKVSFKNIKH